MDNNSNTGIIMEFQGQQFKLNQCTNLHGWLKDSKPGEYTVYYDKLVFHTERNGFIAAYKNNLLNYWDI